MLIVWMDSGVIALLLSSVSRNELTLKHALLTNNASLAIVSAKHVVLISL